MNFLILTRLPEIYSSQRLVQEARSRGHQASTIHPETSWPTTLSTSIVVPRLGSYRYEVTMKQFEKNETDFPQARVLNPSRAFRVARHKKQAHLALAGLPQPQLFEEPCDFPLVLKDCISSKGEGVFLCQTPAELEEKMATLQGREVLFQEYLPECAGKDVRAFVIGEKISASIERSANTKSNEFRANLSLGGTAKPAILSAVEASLCLQAVRRLGLDYGGVDFVRSDRGPLLLEINPCPGLEGIEKCTGVNIAQEVVLYAEGLYTPRL
jgi:ribosomal protein S6--L-glutamate ligase